MPSIDIGVILPLLLIIFLHPFPIIYVLSSIPQLGLLLFTDNVSFILIKAFVFGKKMGRNFSTHFVLKFYFVVLSPFFNSFYSENSRMFIRTGSTNAVKCSFASASLIISLKHFNELSFDITIGNFHFM